MYNRNCESDRQRLCILLINRKALPSIGGKQLYTDRLARGLLREGTEVKLLVTATPPPPDHPKISYPVVYSPDMKEVWQCVRESSVVHFNAFTWRVWLAAKLLQKPMVFVYHETGDRLCARAVNWRFWEWHCHYHPDPSCIWCDELSPLGSPRHWTIKPVQQRFIDRMNAIISPSRWVLDRLPKHACYIPHGIDISEYYPVDNPARDYLLFAGRIVEYKGPDLLIRAVADCQSKGRRVRLLVVGSGPFREDLELLARELGIKDQVEFQGEVPQKNLLHYYQNALALVVPSIWEEMFGLVALEAMACKTPVIASAIGGLKETAGRAGLVFPPGDVAALTSRILELLDDPEHAADMSLKGYRFVMREYRKDKMIDNYLRQYRELTGYE